MLMPWENSRDTVWASTRASAIAPKNCARATPNHLEKTRPFCEVSAVRCNRELPRPAMHARASTGDLQRILSHQCLRFHHCRPLPSSGGRLPSPPTFYLRYVGYCCVAATTQGPRSSIRGYTTIASRLHIRLLHQSGPGYRCGATKRSDLSVSASYKTPCFPSCPTFGSSPTVNILLTSACIS